MSPAAIITWLAAAPWAAVLVFVGASLLLVWALERMADHGLEGTALGTIAMPYCSGLGNLLLVALVARQVDGGAEIAVNSVVNNVTNLTLLLGLPALLWGLSLTPQKRRSKKAMRAATISRLSLLLSLAAGAAFAGVLFALAMDGSLDRGDGAALVMLFLFWQSFQVYDVTKTQVQQNRTLHLALVLDGAVMLVAGAAIYLATEGLVAWIDGLGADALGGHGMGWITGWVMVLPNALLALFYGWRRRADIVYSSQLGDGHICIPLGVGLAALVQPFAVPATVLEMGLGAVGVAIALHAGVLVFGGVLPRWLGLGLVGAYGVFLYRGLG